MAARVWPVFVVYLLAFVAIIAFTIVAAVALRALYPDLGDAFGNCWWNLGSRLAS